MKNREEFLLDRKQGIGGSDVAAIMGLSPWKTALGVYLDKVSDVNDQDRTCLKRGRKLEKYILEEYAEDKGITIETDLSQYKDEQYPFLVGHLDGKVKDRKIFIEAKSYYGSLKDWEREIPIYYKTQVAHYAYLTDADTIDIAVLGDHWKYGCYTYHRDKAFERKIREASINFWHNHIVKKLPPKPVCISDANLLYHTAKDASKHSNKDIDTSILKLIKLQESKKNIAKEEELLKTSIMDYMGESSGLTTNCGVKISWKKQKQHRINANLLKKDNPVIYEKYCHDIEVRPFKLIKEKI